MSLEAAISFPFLANAVWLDFVNTEVVTGGKRLDLLTDFPALLHWESRAGLLGSEEIALIERGGPAQDGSGALHAARRLRAGLRDAAASLAAGRPVAPGVVVEVNGLLARHPTTSSLVRDDSGWAMRLTPARVSAETLLARVAADFAQYLVTAGPGLLKRCARPDCVLYFLDTSKNHSRRWCSMDACGNREKAAGRRARDRAR
jgi:predicted RNA-binding Zn ribbon-like protein